ncbi:MAG: 30S ribosomal protein S19 [Candidatus Woesearchaeota archaeon]
MARKEFNYYGKSLEDLQKMTIEEFAKVTNSRLRRSIKRGLTDEQKKLLKAVERNAQNIETHCRDMPILPSMVGKTIKVHDGKTFNPVQIEREMLGKFLGEFSMTRRKVSHSAPGIGATKSSASISVK